MTGFRLHASRSFLLVSTTQLGARIVKVFEEEHSRVGALYIAAELADPALVSTKSSICASSSSMLMAV